MSAVGGILVVFAMFLVEYCCAMQYYDLKVPQRQTVVWSAPALLDTTHLSSINIEPNEMRQFEMELDFGYAVNVFTGQELEQEDFAGVTTTLDLARIKIFIASDRKMNAIKKILGTVPENYNFERFIFRNSVGELKCRGQDQIKLTQEQHLSFLNICMENGVDGFYNTKGKRVGVKRSRKGFGVILVAGQANRKFVFIPNWRVKRSTSESWLLEIRDGPISDPSFMDENVILDEMLPRSFEVSAEEQRAEEDPDSYMLTTTKEAGMSHACPVCLNDIGDEEVGYRMKDCPQRNEVFHRDCLQMAYTSTGRCPMCNINH